MQLAGWNLITSELSPTELIHSLQCGDYHMPLYLRMHSVALHPSASAGERPGKSLILFTYVYFRYDDGRIFLGLPG